MANLSIISACNRRCSYCFAEPTMEAPGPDARSMPLDEFERGLDLLERSGIDEVPLLGGEPTIHPLFLDFVDLALERGFRLLVLSGGLIPETALARLASLPEESVRVLVNVAIPGESPAVEFRRQSEVYERLGPRVMLGFNIRTPGVELDFLIGLIERHGLARAVRLGLTHPILEGGNQHLHTRYFDEVGRRVADFAFRAREQGIDIEFDCGWVPCMFPDGALDALGITPDMVGLRCNPILDVLAGGEAISCYPLAGLHREKIRPDDDTRSLAGRFTERLAPLRPVGIFRKCADCGFRARGECVGGCLSSALRRLQGHEFALAFPEPAPAAGRMSLSLIEPPGSCKSGK